MSRRAFARVTLFAVVLSAACAGHKAAPVTPPQPVIPEPTGPNTLTQAERRSGWELLFDGTTLNGWHTYKQAPGITSGWTARDGMIMRTASAGDLVSDKQYDSFQLELEWKVAPGANSGVFFWGNEGTEVIYMNAPEMQILDNTGHEDGKSPLTAAGSLYALYPSIQSLVKPVGEWNKASIVAHGSKVQFWLNGVKVVDVNFDSKEVKDKIAASKFKDWETFGKARRGHLALQEHGGLVWFRNIKLKEFQ
jgi:hypothetical protein